MILGHRPLYAYLPVVTLDESFGLLTHWAAVLSNQGAKADELGTLLHRALASIVTNGWNLKSEFLGDGEPCGESKPRPFEIIFNIMLFFEFAAAPCR